MIEILNKEQFIQQWIIAFTSSYAAKYYDENCSNGWRDNETFMLPCDAYLMAEEAWRLYQPENKNIGWEEARLIKKGIK